MRYQIILFSLLLLCGTDASAEWDIWIMPQSRTYSPGDQFSLTYGITGMGALHPGDVKITIYAEKDTQLKLDHYSLETYEVVVSMLRPDTPEDIFTRRAEFIPEPYNLGLHVEHASPFPALHVTPHSRGDKTITFYLTYKDTHGEWRTRSREFEYYVYSWKERNEWWITWIAVFAAITGIWANLFTKKRYRRANKTMEPTGDTRAGNFD